MLIYIAKKEILEHIKSFRFIAAFLFIIVTFFLMMFTRNIDYKAKYGDYLLRVQNQETALDKYAYINRIGWLTKPIAPPSTMEIIVDPAVTSDLVDESSRSLDEDPFNTTSIDLDIIALVGMLGSLLALILSYDSVNREVHEGTLRLLLSSAVPRIKVIYGKILGGAIAAILPIAVILIFTSIWLAISGGLGWGWNQWGSFLVISLISIIYVMFFYCLGVFLSSVILDQTLSALSCFAVWILFVLVIPVIGPYIANSAVRVPNRIAVQRQLLIYEAERDAEIQRSRATLIAQGLSVAEALEKINIDEIIQRWLERRDALHDNYKIAVTRRTKVAIRLACVSPYSMYLFAVEELSGLGIERFQYLETAMKDWNQKFAEFAQKKGVEAQRLNPAFAFSGKIDLSGMTPFKYIEPDFSSKFSNAILYILPLLGYFLIPLFLFLFAFNSKRTLL